MGFYLLNGIDLHRWAVAVGFVESSFQVKWRAAKIAKGAPTCAPRGARVPRKKFSAKLWVECHFQSWLNNDSNTDNHTQYISNIILDIFKCICIICVHIYLSWLHHLPRFDSKLPLATLYPGRESIARSAWCPIWYSIQAPQVVFKLIC